MSLSSYSNRPYGSGSIAVSTLFFLLCLPLWVSSSSSSVGYRGPRVPKFEVRGPVVTITMKEAEKNPPTDGTGENGSKKSLVAPWVLKDVASIKPQSVWSIQTLQPPLPVWLPNLKQISARLTYEYHKLKFAPSVVETTCKFSTDMGDVEVQPTIDLCTQQTDVSLSFSRGTSYVKAKLLGGKRFLQKLQGSVFFNLPYSTVRTVRCTPLVNFQKGYADFSCLVEATTGGAGRTKAILNMEYDSPTLALVHRLDDRNTVSPEINIWNARITYQWDMLLSDDGTSFVRTKVDPLSAIHVSWTDQSARDGGLWVTDVRLPLEGTTVSALAADVRIRRQFKF